MIITLDLLGIIRSITSSTLLIQNLVALFGMGRKPTHFHAKFISAKMSRPNNCPLTEVLSQHKARDSVISDKKYFKSLKDQNKNSANRFLV
jgi:hypothetical protein